MWVNDLIRAKKPEQINKAIKTLVEAAKISINEKIAEEKKFSSTALTSAEINKIHHETLAEIIQEGLADISYNPFDLENKLLAARKIHHDPALSLMADAYYELLERMKAVKYARLYNLHMGDTQKINAILFAESLKSTVTNKSSKNTETLPIQNGNKEKQPKKVSGEPPANTKLTPLFLDRETFRWEDFRRKSSAPQNIPSNNTKNLENESIIKITDSPLNIIDEYTPPSSPTSSENSTEIETWPENNFTETTLTSDAAPVLIFANGAEEFGMSPAEHKPTLTKENFLNYLKEYKPQPSPKNQGWFAFLGKSNSEQIAIDFISNVDSDETRYKMACNFVKTFSNSSLSETLRSQGIHANAAILKTTLISATSTAPSMRS